MNLHDEIKSRIDCFDICRHYGYEISNGNFLRCSNEKTPSLKLHDDGTFKCWRCGTKAGDCFDLLIHVEGMSKQNALEVCADIAGVKISKSEVHLAKKVDLKALREAMTATSLDLPYTESDFRFKALYELYKAILLGISLDHTEKLRVKLAEVSDSWDKRSNTDMNIVIDYLYRG